MSKTYFAYQKTDDEKTAKLVSFGSGAQGEQTIINLGVPTPEPQTQNTKKILRNKNFPLINNNRIYELCFADFVTDKTRIVQYESDNTKGFLNCDRFNTGYGAYCKNSDNQAVKMFYQFELFFDDSLTEQEKDAIVFAQLDGEAIDGTKKIDESNTLTINAKEDETDEQLTSASFDLYYKKDSTSGNRYLYTKATNQTVFSSIYSMVFGTKLYTLLNDVNITRVDIRGFDNNNICIADESTYPTINWAYVPCVIAVNESSELSSVFQGSYCFSIGQQGELLLHKTSIDFGREIESQLLVNSLGDALAHIDLTYVLCNNYNI